jgi:hypothetical protein
MLPELTTDDIAAILDLLPDGTPHPDMVKAIAEYLLARKHADWSLLSEAVKVVQRVANARNLPQD